MILKNYENDLNDFSKRVAIGIWPVFVGGGFSAGWGLAGSAWLWVVTSTR